MSPDRDRAPKGVIFDWDNTLVDSWACIHEAMNRTLERMGHPLWTFGEMKSRVALSLRDSFPGLFGHRWEQAREVFYDVFNAIHLDHLRPLPHIPAMLEALRDHGIRLAVVSNKNGDFLREEVFHLGWGEMFDRVIGATDAVRDKPDPAPVDLAFASMGCGPEGPVWFVGDASVDMDCAARTGCVPVLMRVDPPGPAEFDGTPFRWHLKDGNALLALVRELVVDPDA